MLKWARRANASTSRLSKYMCHFSTGGGPEVLPVTIEDIIRAEMKISSGVKITQTRKSNKISALLGCEVYFKTEFLQESGSFKERGARNAMLHLKNREAGVVAASAGNHALALAYHGQQLGIPVTVVMPKLAPMTKIENCSNYGANVVLHGAHILEAYELARELEERDGSTYINGFDDPLVIAGAGTIGLEILRQVEDVDYIVVPVGGGGLVSGICAAVKSLKPEVKVIGVEPLNAACLGHAFHVGKPEKVEMSKTLADGLAVPKIGDNSFQILQRHLDKLVTVSEEEIALAVLRLLELEKFVVEGAGAAGLAALLNPNLLPELKGKKVVIPLCGGNIDAPILCKVIDRGLATDHRLLNFHVIVEDLPGGLANACSIIASVGANVQQVFHERAWLKKSVMHVKNQYLVEVRNKEHAQLLVRTMRENGMEMLWDPWTTHGGPKNADSCTKEDVRYVKQSATHPVIEPVNEPANDPMDESANNL